MVCFRSFVTEMGHFFIAIFMQLKKIIASSCSRTGFAIFVIWTWAGFDPTCVSPINWFETVMPLVTALASR